jgi:predicted ferric reductase
MNFPAARYTGQHKHAGPEELLYVACVAPNSAIPSTSKATMTLLDICSYLGLGAAGGATLNLLLGLLISMRYSPVRYWPHRRLNLFAFHQWTAYATILLVLTHPLVLLFIDKPPFRIFDILLPIQSPLQPLINLAGAAAMYLLLIVFLTSLLRSRVGRPLWRRLHYLVFPAAVLIFVHSIFTDPDLKDGHPDLLDGGKIFVEILALICFFAIILRIRLRGRGMRPAAAISQKN